MKKAERLAGSAPGPDHRCVDVHTHVISPHLDPVAATFPCANWPSVRRTGETTATIFIGDKPFRAIDERCWSVSRRLADMDDDGVDVQVISPVPVTFCYDAPADGAVRLAAIQNEFMAAMAQESAGRLLALAALPMQSPTAALAELRAVMSAPEFVGVEIGTQVDGIELSDPVYAPFFDAAAELGALVLVHPGEIPGGQRLARQGLSFGVGMPCETAAAAAGLLAVDIFDRRPNLKIVLAHGGGALAMIYPRIRRGFALRKPTDGPALAPHNLFFSDSLTYDALSLRLAIGRFGSDRILLGTDYPFAAREDPPGAAITELAAAGTGEDCSGIWGANALRLLRLRK